MQHFARLPFYAGFLLTVFTTLSTATSHADTRDQVAIAPSLAPSVKVASTCEGDKANFRITNTGARMADPAIFRIEKVRSGEVVTGRKLVMKGNQTASFVPSWKSDDGPLRLVMESPSIKGGRVLSEIDCGK
ncbi:MAG: hypothetical protein OQJ87_12545 [Rhodospirillales bacterium]|nr:hypothetical protein [Rhodospirillales bacterium]